MPDRRDIMGVAVTAASNADAVAMLDARLNAGERIKLAFLNAHGSNLAARDAAFRTLLADFTVLNDGIGVNIASRVLHGRPFPDNLNGTDFIPRYLRETSLTFRIFLLGAQPGVAEEAAAALLRQAPQHVIAGTRSGFFAPGEAADVARQVAATSPHLVLVAMGNPVQERFISEQFEALGCRMAMGVGALFDFLAGRVKRAPAVFRTLRSEWVYRLALEPARMWRRYVLGNPKFLGRLAIARLRRPPR